MNVQGYLKKGEPWSIGKTREPKQILEYPQRYLAQYPDVFGEEEFDKLPPRRPWDHCIELNADFKLVNCKIYALTLDEQKALDVFLEENLRSGRIRPSNSPMPPPLLLHQEGRWVAEAGPGLPQAE